MTKGYLSFILTYRLSQDPLENFFSCIRSASSLENNTNPTVPHFISSFKKFMTGAINKFNYGNCLLDDSVRILVQQPTTTEAVQEVEDEYDLMELGEEQRKFIVL